MFAYTAPEMLCHTLNTAPGTAASGMLAKCTVASELASPEFCMPTSMDSVRICSLVRRRTRPTRYPRA